MQLGSPARVRSAINVTPLVDVVLVLLIIFMVIAPQLQAGPPLRLPATDGPRDKPDADRQILVSIEANGTIWLDGARVTAEQFPQRIGEAAMRHPGRRVVIKGDARLTFGDVQRVMLAVEALGFKDVGLIAKRHEDREG